jgi:DNA-binding response OmpR family regulator
MGNHARSPVIHILLIEDSSWIQESLTAFFRKDGFALCIADTAEKGFKLARAGRFDAILVSEELPGMTGIECLCRLHQTRAVKVFIASRPSGELFALARISGADICISKPFNAEFLENEIVALVQHTCDGPDQVLGNDRPGYEERSDQ